MREGQKVMHSEEVHTHLIRYEDLTLKPERVLEQLMEFCQLPVDEIMMSYASNTLAPTPSRGHCELHPAIRPIFEETLEELGYK